MQKSEVLNHLGYLPNDSLEKKLEDIQNNTHGYEKIIKHIMDLHDALKVDESYVAMSNSHDYFKIKIEAPSPERVEEAQEKVSHFKEKFKVLLEKVDNKETYYIVGFAK
jgi:acetolactate synthase small subunit